MGRAAWRRVCGRAKLVALSCSFRVRLLVLRRSLCLLPKLSVKNQKIPRIVRDSGGQCLPLAVAAAAAVDAADGLSGIFLRAGCVRAGDRLARRGALDADGRAAKAHLAVSADDDGLTAACCALTAGRAEARHGILLMLAADDLHLARAISRRASPRTPRESGRMRRVWRVWRSSGDSPCAPARRCPASSILPGGAGAASVHCGVVISIGHSLSFSGRRLPMSFSTCPNCFTSSMQQKEMAVPSRPARPVRPMRWTYASGSIGIS